MDAHDKQQRRLTAAALFEQDERSDTRIGDLLGVTARAVNHWRRARHQGGTEALTSKGRTGPKGYLDSEQRRRLRHLLRRGAKDYGFATDGWTLNRVRRVIAETFGAAYADPSRVWRLLKAMGWSVQVPVRRAVERDEEAIAAWVEQTWPRIEKRGPRPGPGSSSRTRPARD
ncbi:winged helix-turn-helix domain-containing protein [Thermobifida halotolerans]|uniref:Winged helix-turn-helix domain-containing protein n=1 Tax=Thermobifida halotolerans TaxID=483545 RepID=A0AA97M111_9ACTN|nr:winged helix-turn-helix domain-containing protein [Thermobifida halotolerans]UOE21435.1 winged helix-turn-helix domain-containing protein [Thermobifida halotolerans]